MFSILQQHSDETQYEEQLYIDWTIQNIFKIVSREETRHATKNGIYQSQRKTMGHSKSMILALY